MSTEAQEVGRLPEPADERQTVSVVIPTLNAAEFLPGCLDSIEWADEIVVVDRFSSDATPEICRSHARCRFFQREGYILTNQNYGFEQARSDWILRLDADERVTPELAEEIKQILLDPPVSLIGFECWERIFILGRELRNGFGRRHHRKMLFRRGSVKYPGVTEHDDLTGEGEWGRTQHGYVHLNYNAVGEYLVKMNYYTDADVERCTLPDTAPPRLDGVKEPARAFYLYYLKWRGYRDGWIGLLDAGMRSVYQFVYWSKLRARWETERGTTP